MTLNGERVECQLRDPCVQCMHGVPHPPLLIAYNESAGNYDYQPERVCMARWASTNGSHKAGSICGAPVTRHAGDVDLCQHHFNRVYEWRFWEKPLEDIKEKTAAIKAADAEYRQAVLESEIHRERVRAEHSVVYYIRRVSDGMIKIGTTTSFRTRMATHRKEHGEIQILLTHSGTRKEERESHLRFDVYRAGRSEWFYPTRPLLNWILDAQRTYSHKKTQGLDIMTRTELRKIIRAAPADAYQWRHGKLVPVRRPADPAA